MNDKMNIWQLLDNFWMTTWWRLEIYYMSAWQLPVDSPTTTCWLNNIFFLEFKVKIFWEGHKIWKNLPLRIWRYSVRFCQILWPSQNIRILPKSYQHLHQWKDNFALDWRQQTMMKKLQAYEATQRCAESKKTSCFWTISCQNDYCAQLRSAIQPSIDTESSKSRPKYSTSTLRSLNLPYGLDVTST